MEQPADLLNEHQHRALSTRMRILDRELYEAERFLKGDLPSSFTFEMTSDLADSERETLLALVGEGRSLVRGIRQRFALTFDRQSLRQWILGHFSVTWAILEDSHADKLKGFGEVAERLPDLLDPEINQLIGVLNSIKAHLTRDR